MVNMWNTGEMAGRVRIRRKKEQIGDLLMVTVENLGEDGDWLVRRGEGEVTVGIRRLTVSVRNRGEKEQLLVTVRNSGRSRPRWRVCRLQVFRSTLD